MMNALQLLKLFYSHGLKREWLIFLEVILLSALMTVVLLPCTIEIDQLHKLQTDFPAVKDSVLIGRKSGGTETGLLTEERLQEAYPDCDKIYWSESGYMHDLWEHETLFHVLSHTLYEDARYALSEGLFTDEPVQGRIPVIVNSVLASVYPVGSEIDLRFGEWHADEKDVIHVPGIVTGILSDHEKVKLIGNGAYTKTLYMNASRSYNSSSDGNSDFAALIVVENERLPIRREKPPVFFIFRKALTAVRSCCRKN